VENYFQIYNQFDAQVLYRLKMIDNKMMEKKTNSHTGKHADKGKFWKDHFIDFVQYKCPKTKEERIMIFTCEHLVFIKNNLVGEFKKVKKIKLISYYEIDACQKIEIAGENDDIIDTETKIPIKIPILKLTFKKEGNDIDEELLIACETTRIRIMEIIRNLRIQQLERT